MNDRNKEDEEFKINSAFLNNKKEKKSNYRAKSNEKSSRNTNLMPVSIILPNI